MDPGEFFASMHAALFLIPVVGVLAMGAITDWAQWAVERGILAAASEEPLLALPLAGGAGFDSRRIIIAAVVLIAITIAVTAVTRPYRHRAQLRSMREGDMS